MNNTVSFVTNADGDLSARVAHLVIGLIPIRDGTFRTLSAYPARDPAQCKRSDFMHPGFVATDEGTFRAEVEEYAEHHRQLALLNRRPLTQADLRGVATPWDAPDHGHFFTEGLAELKTPGHGGFVLTAAMNSQIDERWRSPANEYGGRVDEIIDPNRQHGILESVAFYEEVQQWAIVAFSFPNLFTDYEKRHARTTLMRDYPDEWEAITGEMIPDGFSPTRNLAQFRVANKDAWFINTTINSKTQDGKVIAFATVGGRDKRGNTRGTVRRYMLCAEEYERRYMSSSVGQALIDENTDMLVDHNEVPILRAA